MCAFDDKRFLLEDAINSLAFGHKDIPARVENIEDEGGNGEVVITRAEARAEGILVNRPQQHGDEGAAQNPRPPCIWMERRRQRVENAREFIRTQLGFGEDDDDNNEHLASTDEDEDEDDDGDGDEGTHRTRTTAHNNPFILDSASVEHSRTHKRNRLESDSDSD